MWCCEMVTIKVSVEGGAASDKHGDDDELVRRTLDEELQTLTDRQVLVSAEYDYHSDILDWYQNKLRSLSDYIVRHGGPRITYTAHCMGGGILTIDKELKTIETYGKSYGFGPPDIKQVKRILKIAYGTQRQYKLDIKITDEIRG
eukprot:gene10558-12283_t